mgnify:CR=1 FL=1
MKGALGLGAAPILQRGGLLVAHSTRTGLETTGAEYQQFNG